MNKEPTAWRDPFRTTIPWNPERDQIQFKHFSVRYRRIYKPKFFKLSCSAYLYVGMFHRPCHWYGFIESQPSVFMPQYIPKPLHTSTSIIHCARKNGRKWGKETGSASVQQKRGRKMKRNTHMVPPALREVWQLVLQTVLQKLKHHTDYHTHPPVSDHKCLTNRNDGTGISTINTFLKKVKNK